MMRRKSTAVTFRYLAAIVVLTNVAIVALTDGVFPQWPSAPVRVIVPFAAGGANDLLARGFGDVLAQSVGQQFVVENRTGGAGLIGTQAVARAAPDGQLLLASGMGGLVVSPAMSASPGFDALQDFTHIAFLGGTPHVLVSHPSLGVKSFGEFVATVRKDPNGTGYLTASQGSPGHLVGELLSERQRLKLVHVAYRGAGQAINDLLAGHVKVGLISYSTARQHIASGTLTALAVSSEKRLPILSDVPTFNEMKMPELVTTSWYGLSGPAKMRAEIVTLLNQHVNKAVSSPLIQRIMAEQVVLVTPMSSVEFTLYVKREIEKWTPFARKIASVKP